MTASRGGDGCGLRLTGGEERIASLAGGGRRNNEIAHEVGLSPKTVEWLSGGSFGRWASVLAPSGDQVERCEDVLTEAHFVSHVERWCCAMSSRSFANRPHGRSGAGQIAHCWRP